MILNTARVRLSEARGLTNNDMSETDRVVLQTDTKDSLKLAFRKSQETGKVRIKMNAYRKLYIRIHKRIDAKVTFQQKDDFVLCLYSSWSLLAGENKSLKKNHDLQLKP